MKILLLFVAGSQEGGEGAVEKTIERVADRIGHRCFQLP
jgi:hypothetical protein